MGSGVARPQASVERWGDRALLPPEGTRPQLRCQRGQPSTSTSGLRVAPGDWSFRHCDVEVGRAAGRRPRERRDDPMRDRNLEREIHRRSEAYLEPAAQTEGDLAVERTDKGDAAGEAATDEGRQGASGEAPVVPAEQRTELDARARRKPDAPKLAMRSAWDGRDHSPPRGDQEGVDATPKHGDRQL